jgi:hypothetical protein
MMNLSCQSDLFRIGNLVVDRGIQMRDMFTLGWLIGLDKLAI